MRPRVVFHEPGHALSHSHHSLPTLPHSQPLIVPFRSNPEDDVEEGDSSGSDLARVSLEAPAPHVVILDRSGTIVASNLAWQRFAVASRLTGDARGRPNYPSLYDKLGHRYPETRVIRGELAAVLSGRTRAMRRTYPWRGPDGLRWFELSASPLESEPYVIVVNRDITEGKETERALGEASEHLLKAQEEERRRIAEELHDSTTQHVVAAGLDLMNLKARVDARGEVLEFIERIERSLAEASKELRSFTYLLHPPFLEKDGLARTLQRYVEGFSRRADLEIRLRIARGVDELPGALQRPIFRVLQEALANVHRHASASRACIDLRCIRARLHLVVRDNGCGMGSPDPGVGIAGISARLRQFEGRMAIRSGPGGTILHAVVPILTGTSHRG